mgnify:CR=1 FL=1
MLSKPTRILTNAALVFAFWIGSGVVCWLVLKHFDPASWLVGKDLEELGANMRTLSATVAQIAATMAGFVLAALALLLSLSERELIKRMSVSGHLHVLIIRMKLSMVLCLVLTVGGVAFIVIPGLGTTHLYLAASACVPVAMSFLDVLWKLVMVFFFLSPLPKEDPRSVRTLYADTPPV